MNATMDLVRMELHVTMVSIHTRVLVLRVILGITVMKVIYILTHLGRRQFFKKIF